MKLRLLSLLLLPALATGLRAGETKEQRDTRMNWWREARFGMFVHWGLYSGLAGEWQGKKVGDKGGMEWIQTLVGADTKTYAAAATPLFKPKKGFATAWAKLAKQAGCEYVVFTTKHHEGFFLGDSKFSDYDAGDLLQRDLIKEIVDALRKEGLRVGFYHSLIDWHHPQYDYRKAKGLPYPKNGMNPAESRDHSKYIEFLHNQVGELVSNYGKTDVIWWDYSSTQFDGDAAWRAGDLIREVRAKQPGVIMNNRLYRRPEAGFAGMGTSSITNRMDPQYGDFVTPEQHIPETGLGEGVDWETCMTLNTTWGYSKFDNRWKSSRDLIRNLCDVASKGGNYLLNIGPTGDGSLTPETTDRFEDIGQWMEKHHDAIYGTTAGDFTLEKGVNGRVTKKGNTRFLLLFERPATGVVKVPITVKSAKLDGKSLEVKTDGDATILTLPAELPDAAASVITLE